MSHSNEKRKSKLQIILPKGNFSQVPNEILEVLMEKDLTGLEFRICFFMIRNLTGWNYEFKPVSIAEIAHALCHDNEKQIIKALANLVKQKILSKIKTPGIRSYLYGFNKEEIGRSLIGDKRKYYREGTKVIDLETFKILKVRNLTPSECESLHPEGAENHTFKNERTATEAVSQAPKYTEIPINTHSEGGGKKLTWEHVREILLEKFPNDAKRLDKTYQQISQRGYEQEGRPPFMPNHLPAWFLSRYGVLRDEYAFHDERRA